MSTTHWSWPNVVPRSVAMSGSATFTIVTSTRSMKVPVQTATSGSHVRTDAPCPRSAVCNQSVARIGGARTVTVGSPFVSAVDLLIAAGVALLAGGINSIAGGGSLILFPTLVGLGLGTVQANVTNSIAQWPGYVGGVLGFRTEYEGQRSRLIRFGITAALGGTAGSVLLLTTPSEAFETVVPVLVFLASILLAFQPLITKRLRSHED